MNINKLRILVVEDDPTTSRSIELMLTHANFKVYTTDLGEEALFLAQLYDYDLITLDLNLPDISDFEVLRQLRERKITTPVLVLSGADDVQNKLKAFGLGADDYLTKPFHREELVARIHAIIRRSKGHSQSVIRTGKVTVNLFGWFANAIEAGRRVGQPLTEAVEPDTDDLKKDATGATEGCQCPVCRIKRMLSEVKSGIDNDQQKRMSKDFWEMIEGLGEKNISDGLITLVGEDAETFYRTGKLPDNILKEMQASKPEKSTKH